MPERMTRLYILLLVAFLVACAGAATPKDATQTIYSVGWTLVGATNSVADLHDAGTLKGQDYENAKATLKSVNESYASARAALGKGDSQGALTYLRLAQTLLNQLAATLAAREAK